jgi:alkylation response protein AidB-like acyl-CoA dehydrogenase
MVVHLDGHVVPAERVALVEPQREWLARDALGLRSNGSTALGITARALRLLGPSPLDAALVAARDGLDAASPDDLPAARAAATELAVHATAALVASCGGRALHRDAHAQRLAREALFLLVQGQTPTIRAEQVRRFTTTHPGRVTPGP